MTNSKIEQKNFTGSSGEVLGKVLACIEETKSVLESEALQGYGFGLIFYRLDNDRGDVAVLRSDKVFRHLDSVEPSPPVLFAEKAEEWSRSFNILRDWKHVQPSSIIFGWKCNKLSFTFSHSMAIPTVSVDEFALEPGGVVECHVFRSISPSILPFILIDGAVSAAKPNTLCMLQAAPEEILLYSRLKNRAEHDKDAKEHYIKAMLASSRPAILVRALRYLNQMKCSEELVDAAVKVCCENLSCRNGKLLEVMEQSRLRGTFTPLRGNRFSERLAAVVHKN
jgi:hypothetical protein